MRLTWLAITCGLLVACKSHGSGDDTGGDGGTDIARIEVQIASPQLHWADGMADASDVRVIAFDSSDQPTDVTAQAAFVVSPVELAGVDSAKLSATGTTAGPGELTATVGGASNNAAFEVFMTKTVPGSADPSVAGLFGGATLDPSATVQIAYPPAGALVPPNLGDMDVHWRDASGKDVYQVQLAGGFVTLTTYVTSLGAATWDTLSAADWQLLSAGRTGVDLAIRVRGLATAAPSTFIEGTETVRIADEAVKGGVYYWNTSKAAVMRFDMEDPTTPPEQFYPLAGDSGCVGCHAVSRDGSVVAYRQEGSNLNYGNALDVASRTKQLTVNTQQWNFASIHPNNIDMFTTTETGLYRTDLSTKVTTPLYTAQRIAQPDTNAAGTAIVATVVGAGSSEVWTAGGSIVVFDYDAVAKTVSAPRTLVAGGPGASPYYPSFSPDGQWVIYNQAPSGTSYDNPNAQIWVIKADGTQPPIHLAEAEVPGTTNSWPKWTPFVTHEGGEMVIWMTVASRRPFGVRSVGGQKPQLWLAPFYPERAAAGQPAAGAPVRLPFQSLVEGNHIAQWTEHIVTLN